MQTLAVTWSLTGLDHPSTRERRAPARRLASDAVAHAQARGVHGGTDTLGARPVHHTSRHLADRGHRRLGQLLGRAVDRHPRHGRRPVRLGGRRPGAGRAATSVQERAVILHESIRSRLLTSLIAVPAAAIATYLVCGPSYRLESVARRGRDDDRRVHTRVVLHRTGQSARPDDLRRCAEAGRVAARLPHRRAHAARCSGTRCSSWLFTVPAFAVHARLTAHGDALGDARPRRVISVLRTLVPTAAIDATGNAYGSTAIPIATAGLSPEDASAFASADRAYRIGTLAVVA